MHFETAQDWLSYIESLHPSEIELGLKRFDQVALRLGLTPTPKDTCVITVAGTNGKGSTVAAIEALCLACDVSVGVYTSPHLFDFGERIRINGHPSELTDWLPYFEQIEAARTHVGEEVSLTFFEFTTLAALLFLQSIGPRVWVMEIGMGGRLDAVNWLQPSLSIVTRIALDHQQWLGNDLAQVAREKCGIFRQGRPALFSDPHADESVLNAVRASAALVGVSRLYERVDFGFKSLTKEQCVFFGLDLEDMNWERDVPISGPDQLTLEQRVLAAGRLHPDAWAAALQACVLMLPQMHSLTAGRWQRCWQSTVLAGRFQSFFSQDCPQVWVCDVAHNLDAMHLLVQKLESLGSVSLQVVYGVLDDKPWQEMAELLIPLTSHWWVIQPNSHRAVSCEKLSKYLTDRAQSVTPLGLVTDEMVIPLREQIAQNYQDVAVVLVCGSFFSVGPFVKVLSWQDGEFEGDDSR